VSVAVLLLLLVWFVSLKGVDMIGVYTGARVAVVVVAGVVGVGMYGVVFLCWRW